MFSILLMYLGFTFYIVLQSNWNYFFMGFTYMWKVLPRLPTNHQLKAQPNLIDQMRAYFKIPSSLTQNLHHPHLILPLKLLHGILFLGKHKKNSNSFSTPTYCEYCLIWLHFNYICPFQVCKWHVALINGQYQSQLLHSLCCLLMNII